MLAIKWCCDTADCSRGLLSHIGRSDSKFVTCCSVILHLTTPNEAEQCRVVWAPSDPPTHLSPEISA